MLLLPILLRLTLSAPPIIPETWTVSAGDTCANIALRVYGSATAYDRLHEFNALGPLPHNLKPGQVLRLRAVEGPPTPDARLTFLKPAVRTRHLVDWSPASLNMDLYRLDEVNTLRGAGAELTFRDTSTLLLEESALLVVYGEATRSKAAPVGVALADGELRLALAALRPSLEVHTPTAETAISGRGAEAVAEVDAAHTARLSLFEGQATVAAAAASVKFEGGHGTRVRAGERPEPPRVLPAQPVVEGSGVVALWHVSGGASATVRWGPAERATSYRVQLALEPRFVERVADQRTSEPSSTFTALEVGHYLARVISYDDAGLQSRPSTLTPVDVVRVDGLEDAEGVWLPRGQTPSVTAAPDVIVSIDGHPLGPLDVGVHQLVLTRAGVELLRVQLLIAPDAPAIARLAPTRVRLTSPQPLPEGSTLEVTCEDQAQAVTRINALTFEAGARAGRCVVSWRGHHLTAFDTH